MAKDFPGGGTIGTAAEHRQYWVTSTGEKGRPPLLVTQRVPRIAMKRTGFLGDLISWEDGVYGTSESVFAGGA